MDALSARTAVHSLQRLGIEPIVVTGLISESPLAMREAQPLPCPIQSSTDLRTTAFTL